MVWKITCYKIKVDTCNCNSSMSKHKLFYFWQHDHWCKTELVKQSYLFISKKYYPYWQHDFFKESSFYIFVQRKHEYFNFEILMIHLLLFKSLYCLRSECLQRPTDLLTIGLATFEVDVLVGVTLIIIWKILLLVYDTVEYSKFKAKIKDLNLKMVREF